VWSVYTDEPLAERMKRAIDILWLGMAPRDSVTSAPSQS